MDYEEYLLKLATNKGLKLWCGIKCPFSMDRIDPFLATNFRMSSSLHGRYDQVWFFENMIDAFGDGSWKIIMDEMIRLLKSGGILVFRMHVSKRPTLAAVKSFLGRRLNANNKLLFEHIDKDVAICVFSIRRANREIYTDKRWSFIMLTLGNKVDNVTAFLRSVRDIEEEENEIIIVGPQNEEYDKYSVKYVNWELFKNSKYAEISKKKNVAIGEAENNNLLILHDRYVLEADFFRGFEDYGYDFDFLSVLQRKPDGREFPAYKAVSGEFEMNAFEHDDYQSVLPTTFVNGGCIAVKKEIIKKIGFNEFLFWNQMEDVELTRVMMDNGIIPRVNYLSHTKTLELRGSYQFEERKTSEFNFIHKTVMPLKEGLRIKQEKIRHMLLDLYSCTDSMGDSWITDYSGERDRDTDIFLRGLFKTLDCSEYYIYGAGKYSKALFEFLRDNGSIGKLKGFIETSPNAETLFEYPLKPANDISIDRNSLVILGVNRKWNEEIEYNLNTIGFSRYIKLNEDIWRIINK